MNENKTREELLEKFKTLTHKQLYSAYSTAGISSRLVTVFGVGLLYLMITYYSVIALIVGSVLVYLFANFAVGIDETRKIIKQAMNEVPDK
jgi:purine-cytosine permease-like protein